MEGYGNVRRISEEIERQTLAPYASLSSASLGRRYPEEPDEYRLDPHSREIPYDWARKDG